MRERAGKALLLVGLATMILGLWREEALLVLEKAIIICLQCIGIG